MPPTDTLRAYLVEDHDLLRAGVRSVLQAHGTITVVGEAGDHREVVDQITALAPDVAVIGARLDDERGFETCRQIRLASPSVKTLVLTSFPGPEVLRSAVLAGASGVLPKSIPAAMRVQSVTEVARGGTLIDAREVLGLMGREPDFEDLAEDLTARERELRPGR